MAISINGGSLIGGRARRLAAAGILYAFFVEHYVSAMTGAVKE